MERFTISLEESLAQQFDQLVVQAGYQNRSEAVRDLLRQKLTEVNLQNDQAEFCVASLSYVFNHHGRDLAERLMQLTNNGTPPPGACNTWRALYVGVAHACGRPDGPHSFGEQPVAPPFEKPTACGPTCGCA